MHEQNKNSQPTKSAIMMLMPSDWLLLLYLSPVLSMIPALLFYQGISYMLQLKQKVSD